MILLVFLCLIVPRQTVFAQDMDDGDLIDIQGFNYGRLQMAFEIEKNPSTNKVKLAQLVKTIKKNLLWSGIFDLKKRYEDVDLILKLRFIPGYEIRAWIYSPDNKVLFDKRKVLKNIEDHEQVVLKLVEEIIFQLTGEQSILRSAIAYVEKDTERKYRLILTDTFGKKRTVLLNDNKYNILPRWNPDASSILFTTLENSGSMIRQMDMSSGHLTVLFKEIGKLSGGAWGKNGKELVMTLSKNGNSDLFRISLKGKIQERLTFRSTTEASPRLSPNGKNLLFVSNRSGSVQIYQRDLQTRETFRMTFEGNYNFEPNWSNDGAYIIFSGLVNNRYQIFLMDKDGEFVQQITYGKHSAEQPFWSPNGRQILYVSKIKYNQKLFIIRADGTLNRRLTNSEPGINEFNPTWTSNYKWAKK